MTVSELIHPGDKIDIRLIQQMEKIDTEKETAKVFVSSVSNVLNETTLEIAMPMEGTKLILLPLGVRFHFRFYSGNGIYECVAQVKERYKKDNLFLLAVELKTKLSKFQRREYYRIPCLLELQFYLISPEEAALSTTNEIFAALRNEDFYLRQQFGKVLDISGGGIRFISDFELENESCILCVLHLDDENADRQFYVVGKILSCTKYEKNQEMYETRVQFIFKDVKVRESIIQYIFEEERKIRRKKNG